VTARPPTPGWRFDLAVAVLQALDRARQGEERGLSQAALARRLRADPLQLEPLLELLADLGWVAPLDEPGDARHVLLCDPDRTPIGPLLHRTLLACGASTAPFRAAAQLDALNLRQALGR